MTQLKLPVQNQHDATSGGRSRGIRVSSCIQPCLRIVEANGQNEIVQVASTSLRAVESVLERVQDRDISVIGKEEVFMGHKV